MPHYGQRNARPQHSHRNSERHPEREFELEKNRQHNEYEHETLQTVANQQVHAVMHVDRSVHPRLQTIAVGRFVRSCIASHRSSHGQQIFARRAIDRNHHRRIAVDAINRCRIDERIFHTAQIGDRERFSTRHMNDRNLCDLGAHGLFVFATQQNFLRIGFDPTPGQFDVLATDATGDFGQRQIMFTKRGL